VQRKPGATVRREWIAIQPQLESLPVADLELRLALCASVHFQAAEGRQPSPSCKDLPGRLYHVEHDSDVKPIPKTAFALQTPH